jgi:hypothetical protein
MKFTVDGRELEAYQLSNRQMVDLIKNDTKACSDEREYLLDKVLDRFENECCPNCGENNDNVFVRQFSSFVNGKCHNINNVAELMANEHRYLQNEMFKVCLAYIKQLAKAYENNSYDLRNEWACMTSFRIQGFIETL